MYKITTLLDMAKENNNLKSDRELADALGLRHVHQYRTKGVIPTDDTAKKLADLCDLKYEAVLASCHGATAKKSNDKEAVKAWRNIFKLAQGTSMLLAVVAAVSLPSPVHAAAFQVQQVVSFSVSTLLGEVTSNANNVYIMRLCKKLSNLFKPSLNHDTLLFA